MNAIFHAGKRLVYARNRFYEQIDRLPTLNGRLRLKLLAHRQTTNAQLLPEQVGRKPCQRREHGLQFVLITPPHFVQWRRCRNAVERNDSSNLSPGQHRSVRGDSCDWRLVVLVSEEQFARLHSGVEADRPKARCLLYSENFVFTMRNNFHSSPVSTPRRSVTAGADCPTRAQTRTPLCQRLTRR